VNYVPSGVVVWKLFLRLRENHPRANLLCEFRNTLRGSLVAAAPLAAVGVLFRSHGQRRSRELDGEDTYLV
jgi:ABC-type Fe3+ transport system permease subunit